MSPISRQCSISVPPENTFTVPGSIEMKYWRKICQNNFFLGQGFYLILNF